MRSSARKAPSSRPRPSALSRRTVSSYQIDRAPNVDTPASASSILRMGNFVTRLPPDARPRMGSSEKSTSKRSFFSRGWGRRCTVTTSASPFGFAVRYRMRDFGVPFVIS